MGCAVNSELLDLIWGQVDRCGPEGVSCPGCPGVVCPSMDFRALTGAFLVGAIARGLLVVMLAQRLGRASPERERERSRFRSRLPTVATAKHEQLKRDGAPDRGGEDPNFSRHVWLLLANFGGGKWIWATPDFEVQYGDLPSHRIVPIGRASAYPARGLVRVRPFQGRPTRVAPGRSGRIGRGARGGASVVARERATAPMDRGRPGPRNVWRGCRLVGHR